MSKAARAAASARLLLDAGDVDGACNRAYYAMFDAAHAALLWAGAQVSPAETKTHRGLIGALGKHLVKTGLLAADAGKSLNQVERIRLLADYTGEAVDADKARWAVEQAAAFLRTVKQTVGAGKPKSK
jgi:uncharacterized protein (UPF0332 family)